MKILNSKIGNTVNFKAPMNVHLSGGKPSVGKIIDEVWENPEINKMPPRKSNKRKNWGDYSFCSQLIEWDNGEHSIRLTYYRRSAGSEIWRFAGQTTITSEPDRIKNLLQKTLAKKKWFVRIQHKLNTN